MPGFGSLGGTELIIALVIILLLFGAKKIPELARGLGSGVREFRAGTREDPQVKNDDKKGDEELLSAEDDEKAGDEKTDLEKDASVEADKEEQKQH